MEPGKNLSYLLCSFPFTLMITELRSLQLGCHIGGLWFGACGYADDLILLAPNREVLQKMLAICERYGQEHKAVKDQVFVFLWARQKCQVS